ncbi:E3 ubiquitin-protein ligase ATL41 [Carex littledalei]|uniref:RING-type E3 ubiquitin transferase n=1 Tax=Carex littledalei TaxID=544730 RepID=A0A833VC22_9POAL|nr:E3 ubiquitin-protein ligase ATL41 [Carex littledalei]
MFEVEFRAQQQSDARSNRCRRIVLAWIPVVAIIPILFIFINSHIVASLITFLILLFMISFTLYYFGSALPGTVPVEARHTDQPGLSPSIIKEIPTFSYKGNSHNHDLNNGNGSDTAGFRCAVCIATVHDGDMVRQLLMCKHVFHTNCIDTWLPSHSTCPMCRADVKTGKLSSEPREPPV